VIEFILLHERDGAAQRRGFEHDVGVGEEQERPGGVGSARVERMVLSKPAFGQLRDMFDREVRVLTSQALQNRARLIGRAIIDDDDLESRVVQTKERRHGRFDPTSLIARGGDDRHRWDSARRGHVLEEAQPAMATREVDERRSEHQRRQGREQQQSHVEWRLIEHCGVQRYHGRG
jgi:hypothetical protein